MPKYDSLRKLAEEYGASVLETRLLTTHLRCNCCGICKTMLLSQEQAGIGGMVCMLRFKVEPGF